MGDREPDDPREEAEGEPSFVRSDEDVPEPAESPAETRQEPPPDES